MYSVDWIIFIYSNQIGITVYTTHVYRKPIEAGMAQVKKERERVNKNKQTQTNKPKPIFIQINFFRFSSPTGSTNEGSFACIASICLVINDSLNSHYEGLIFVH